MTTQTLLIPCETFSVEAVLAATENLTTLEKLVLRALHAGVQSVDDLNDLFAIGYRPMLQLLLDLLHRSLVTFDFSTGAVHASPDAKRKIETKTLDEIEAIGRTTQEVGLMRDLVSGSLLLQRGQPPVKPATRLATRKPANSVTTIDPGDVAVAIRSELRKRVSRSDHPMYVLEIAFDRTKIQGRIRDLEIAVTATIDHATDRLVIEVTGPEDLPARNRVQIEKALNDLANIDPPDLALKNLRDGATRSEEPPKLSLQGRLRVLHDQIRDLTSADRGTYATRQAALNTLTTHIQDAIVRQHVGSVRAGFITSHDELVETINEMIASATRQVVIACPSARYEATMQFRTAIEKALANGRRFFFLFGKGAEKPHLEGGVQTWLHRLATTYKEQLFFSDMVSARCNAKFVVADGADMLVASREFLNHPPQKDGVATAIRLTAPEPPEEERRPVLLFAAELLGIAKEIFPNFSAAQNMAATPFRLGIVQHPPASTVEPPQVPERAAADGEELDESRVALWLRDWKRQAAELQAWAARIETTYELVRDDAHLQLLYSAFRSAERAVFIGADTIADQAVHRLFIDELATCLKRASVTISYRKCDSRALAELTRVAQEHRRLELRPWLMAGSTPRLLMCDDWAVITSFDFGAVPPNRVGADRFKAPTEIGIRIDGAAAVERIRTDLVAVLPALGSWKGVAEPALSPTIVAPSIGRSIGPLLDEVQNVSDGDTRADAEALARHVGEVLRGWFADAKSTDAAFAELQEMEIVRVPFLDQAIASCLDLHRDDEALRARWLERLVERRWQRRDFAGVVLLLASMAERASPAIPSPHIALLAAHVASSAATEEMFLEELVERLDEHSAIALAALAIPLALFTPRGPVQQLADLRDAVPPPLQRWTDAVIEFRNQHPTGVNPSEVEAVAAKLLGADRRAQARNALKGALRRFLDARSGYPILTLIRGHLIGGARGLQKLNEAVATGDMKFIRQYVAENAAGAEARIDAAIDEIIKRQDWFGEPNIFPARRESMLSELDAIIESARAWVDDTNSSTSRRDSLSDDLIALGRTLARHDAAVAALQNERSYTAVLVADLREKTRILVELRA